MLTRAEVLAAYPTGVVPVGNARWRYSRGERNQMPVRRAVITEGRAAILRSAQFATAMVWRRRWWWLVVLLLQVLAVVAEASVQRVPLHPHQVHMAVVAAAVAAALYWSQCCRLRQWWWWRAVDRKFR